MEATTSARLTKGKWSLTAQTVLMDRFYPGAHELESLKDFERERILGHSMCNSVVFLYPALKVSTNGGEAVCDVCRQPWRGWIWHSKCVRSGHVQRIQIFDEADQKVLGSRVICGQRRSWRFVKPGEVRERKEFCCGNCGFNMGQSCEEFIRHALQHCPSFSWQWDSTDKVSTTDEGIGRPWSMREYRVLWRCHEIGKACGTTADWKEKIFTAWKGAGLRDATLKSLMSMLRVIRDDK